MRSPHPAAPGAPALPNVRQAVASPDLEPVECPSCGALVATPHCARCGERRPESGGLALRHLVGEAVEQFLTFDGTFVRTLGTLLRRPGALTVAYLRGSRVRYTRPIQLFLLVNVAFFLVAPKVGLLRYGTPVPPHPTTAVEQARVDSMLSRSAAGRRELRRMRERRERWEQFVAYRNQVTEARTSQLIGLQFLPGLLALALVCAGRGRYLVGHAVFMLHFAAFALLWEPIGALPIALNTSSAEPPVGFLVVIFASLFGPQVVYLALALRRVYGGSWRVAALRAAAVFGAVFGGFVPFAWVVHTVVAYTL